MSSGNRVSADAKIPITPVGKSATPEGDQTARFCIQRRAEVVRGEMWGKLPN
jgi:hypothetical protein